MKKQHITLILILISLALSTVACGVPFSLPGVNLPDVNVPDVEIPDIEIPEIEVPEIEMPEIEVEVPELDLPKIERGSGIIGQEARQVLAFDKIILNGGGEVTLIQGQKEALLIEAEDNILPKLTSEVEDGTLTLGYDTISWKDAIIPTRTIKYTITVQNLERFTVNGAIALSNAKLQGEEFELKINGAGDFVFEQILVQALNIEIAGGASVRTKGEASMQNVLVNGAGSYNGEGLKSLASTVVFNGAGDVRLWVLNTLDVTINGAGSVSYYGSPVVTQSINGFGSVKHLGEMEP